MTDHVWVTVLYDEPVCCSQVNDARAKDLRVWRPWIRVRNRPLDRILEQGKSDLICDKLRSGQGWGSKWRWRERQRVRDTRQADDEPCREPLDYDKCTQTVVLSSGQRSFDYSRLSKWVGTECGCRRPTEDVRVGESDKEIMNRVWCGMGWHDMAWHGMMWYGIVWYVVVCFCVVQYDVVYLWLKWISWIGLIEVLMFSYGVWLVSFSNRCIGLVLIFFRLDCLCLDWHKYLLLSVLPNVCHCALYWEGGFGHFQYVMGFDDVG